ncbi:MAG: stage III sporulation protein AA [Clostridia bacterium]|nr:stage III sporulation protein AA [Clostridia bacterium]
MQFISQGVKNILNRGSSAKFKSLEEIRLRANKPLMIKNSQGECFLDMEGNMTAKTNRAFVVSQGEIIKTLELMSENSIYAYHEEIKNGFLTLKGGHRIGIAGKVVFDGYHIKNIRDISGLNIRVAREVIGCSQKVIKYILKDEKDIYNTLIISPPQCGKTTLLRDIARVVSDGIGEQGFKGMKVGIIDERSEIAACFRGVPQNRVGIRTDVLDSCPKAMGMTMMLRSMSPNVIITDEIGNLGDQEAVMQLINAGVKIITTAHGYNISGLKSRKEVISLIEEKVFDRYIVLSNDGGPGTVEEVVDGQSMKLLYKKGSENVT